MDETGGQPGSQGYRHKITPAKPGAAGIVTPDRRENDVYGRSCDAACQRFAQAGVLQVQHVFEDRETQRYERGIDDAVNGFVELPEADHNQQEWNYLGQFFERPDDAQRVKQQTGPVGLGEQECIMAQV